MRLTVKNRTVEVRMPSFLDKVKTGAERATFEADRLRRLTQAKSALRALEGDLEQQVGALGQQVLALYDSGCLTQPELLASCAPIDVLRQQIQAQMAEVDRIQQEKPASEPDAEQDRSPEIPAPAPNSLPPGAIESLPGRTCANCHSPLPAGVKFCPECGTELVPAGQ
jgi:hypothetical protein